MMRHRSGPPAPQPSEDGSSSEDDAFSALSRKRKKGGNVKNVAAKRTDTTTTAHSEPSAAVTSATTVNEPPPAPLVAKTSSTKRHHGELSDSRKAKMDALLLELEAETRTSAAMSTLKDHPSQRRPRGATEQRSRGSFVDPGDELLTTNIFVGNMAPSTTEEDMTQLFRQFGEQHFGGVQKSVWVWLYWFSSIAAAHSVGALCVGVGSHVLECPSNA
jgi:RNA recognition motif. (a.k.a. RRM, RBD, or RNP domain)